MKTAAVKLSDTEFDDLRRIIHTRSGVRFPNAERDALENRLSRRLESRLDDFGQYIQLLTTGPYQSEEFQEMFSRIANSETGFFRNRARSMSFGDRAPAAQRPRSDKAAPDLVRGLLDWRRAVHARDAGASHARCASGRLAGRNTRHGPLREALNTASDARYSASALASLDPALAKRYFKEEDGTFTLDPMIRSMVISSSQPE